MALGATTVYSLNIDLANSDRGVYRPLELRVARHPSESEPYFLTRVLAYCFEYAEGIALSNGLFEPDEPTIAIRDLTGMLCAWIDVGAPEAARLHRASKAAPRVVVYTHKDPRQLAARLSGERIHRVEALELYALDQAWLAALAAKLERRMTFSLTIAEQHVYLTIGVDTLPCVIEKISLSG
ncbi:MAG: YaeQ family protein [Steroidobacteraceae bacterium]